MNMTDEEIQRETTEWKKDMEDEIEEIYQMELREYERARASAQAETQAGGEAATSADLNPNTRPDRDAVRTKVIQRVTEQRRQPGSPRIGFDLQPNGVTVTPVEQLPRQEQNRRHDVMRT